MNRGFLKKMIHFLSMGIFFNDNKSIHQVPETKNFDGGVHNGNRSSKHLQTPGAEKQKPTIAVCRRMYRRRTAQG